MKGLCIYCGGKLDREGINCKVCNSKNNEFKKIIRLRKIEDKLCVNCNKSMDREEGIFCKKCTENSKLRARTRSKYRREHGLCVQCGTPVKEFVYCQRCRDMRKTYYNNKKNKIGK